MKLLFFDLETTGTLVNKHGIHQLSGAVVIDGEIKEKFNLHVQPNPQAQIEQAALDVAGVTREQIMAYPPMGQVYNEFVNDILSKYVDRYNKTDKFFLLATTTPLSIINFSVRGLSRMGINTLAHGFGLTA